MTSTLTTAMNPWLDGPLRRLNALFSPAGPQARLTILYYHRALATPDPMFPDDIDAVTLNWQMATLQRYYNVLPLSEAVEKLKAGQLPARAACVTFDDGYADNYTVALPILKSWDIPATFFIAAGYIDGGRMWNDTLIEAIRRAPGPILDLSPLNLGSYPLDSDMQRLEATRALIGKLKYATADEREARCREIVDVAGVAADIPNNIMMTSAQVCGLAAAGMEIGGHTVSHPILARLDSEHAMREIVEGKHRVEAIIGERISLFAYPNGRPGRDYDISHAVLVKKAGFEMAVSTAWGTAKQTTDMYQLPRVAPWDQTSTRFTLRLLAAHFNRVETA